MKFGRKHGDNSTIRLIRSNDGMEKLAVVGTVNDLLAAGILEYCDYDGSTWLAISNTRKIKDHFGKTREEAVELFTAAGY